MKHFDHSINVNESFESFSRCEEVTLNSGGDTEVVTLTCSVSSWPKSHLSWIASPTDSQDQLLSSTKQNCTVDDTNDMYTCTSTATLVLHGLVSRTTNVSCRAHYDTLSHTSDACVTVIYDNFSPPKGMCLSRSCLQHFVGVSRLLEKLCLRIPCTIQYNIYITSDT